MTKKYSIAEARHHFAALVHEVEEDHRHAGVAQALFHQAYAIRTADLDKLGAFVDRDGVRVLRRAHPHRRL